MINREINFKINIGISSCQIGSKVRYNAKGNDVLTNIKRGRYDFNWHPVCPEVFAGLGVPREPIRIVNGNGRDVFLNKAEVKNKKNRKVTKELIDGSNISMNMIKKANCDAFIYMEGSPSCGVYRTTLKNKRLGHPPGVFGSLLLDEKLFLISATDLNSPIKWWDHKRRMLCYIWLKHLEVNNLNDLYQMWHTLKFIIQEIDNVFARNLGKVIANLKVFISEDYEQYKIDILNILRKPQKINQIKQGMWKNYSYAKKHYKLNIDNTYSPSVLRSNSHLVEELEKLEYEFRKLNIIFGPAPIRYNPER